MGGWAVVSSTPLEEAGKKKRKGTPSHADPAATSGSAPAVSGGSDAWTPVSSAALSKQEQDIAKQFVGSQTVSLTDFASRLKKLYPQYSDIPDDMLVGTVLSKYPQFRSRVTFGAPPPESSAVSKSLARKYVTESPAATVSEAARGFATRGLVSPETASKIVSFNTIGKARHEMSDIEQQINFIASRPTDASYTPEQKSADLHRESLKIHALAQAVGQDETAGRILSGLSSPTGIAMFVASLFPGGRVATGAAGAVMSAEQMGKRETGESNADFLERNLLAASGLAGSLGMLKEPIVKTSRALGEGGESLAASEGLPVKEAAGAGSRSIIQELGQAGREDIAKAVREHGERVRANYDKAVESANNDFLKEIDTIRQKYEGDVEKQKAATDKLEKTYQEKLQKASDDWKRGAKEALDKKKFADAVQARREALENGQEVAARETLNNLKQTYNNLGDNFKQRWNAQRDFVSNYSQVKMPGVFDAIRDAREQLGGTPASVGILDQIERAISEDAKKSSGGTVDVGEAARGRVPKPSVPFDQARTNFSRLVDTIHGIADANVRRVLYKTVYEAENAAIKDAVKEAAMNRSLQSRDPVAYIEKNLGKSKPQYSLEDIKAGDEAVARYEKLKSDWKQFKDDWDDRGNISEGASPLVHAVRVEAPKDALASIEKFPDQMRKALSRYSKQGGNVNLIDRTIELSDELKSLPSVKEKPEIPSAEEGLRAVEGALGLPEDSGLRGKASETPMEQRLQEAGVKPIQRPPEPSYPEPVPEPTYPAGPGEPQPKPVQDVNAFKIRLTDLERFSKSRLNLTDVILPWDGVLKLLLKNRNFKEWVASQPRVGDPDYIPPAERTGLHGRTAEEAVTEIRQQVSALEKAGTSSLRDYVRGAITRDGYIQRLKSLFPDASAEDVQQTANQVDIIKRAVDTRTRPTIQDLKIIRQLPQAVQDALREQLVAILKTAKAAGDLNIRVNPFVEKILHVPPVAAGIAVPAGALAPTPQEARMEEGDPETQRKIDDLIRQIDQMLNQPGSGAGSVPSPVQQ